MTDNPVLAALLQHARTVSRDAIIATRQVKERRERLAALADDDPARPQAQDDLDMALRTWEALAAQHDATVLALAHALSGLEKRRTIDAYQDWATDLIHADDWHQHVRDLGWSLNTFDGVIG